MRAVVRNAGQGTGLVRAVRGLKPPPVARLMNGHAKAQTLLARSGLAHVPTTSRCGPMLTAFHGWCFEFQASKPS